MLHHRHRIAAVLAVVALTAAACGGEDGAATTDTPPTTAAPGTTAAPAGSTTTTAAPAAPTAVGATVVVDGEEFVLDNELVCVSMGGAVGATFGTDDGTVTFNVDLPPESWDGTTDDWEPASVRLDDERDEMDYRSWRAGGEVVASMTGIPAEVMVTGYTIDGSSGAGTAVVVDINAAMAGEAETIEMTFSFSCG